MSAVLVDRPRRRSRHRLRRLAVEAGSLLLGAVILVWSLLPVYNMLLVALDPIGHNEFAGRIVPPHPTLANFAALWSESADGLEHLWRQFGNSLVIGALVAGFTVLVSSLASFAIGRMRLARDWTLSGAALFSYVIPSSTLIIPFLRVMHFYGLMDNLWSVVAAEVALATPYAILVLLHYARLVPRELDEAARIDGASALQVYWRVYVPLMAPALAAVGTYALLFAWNDYFYQYMLLPSESHSTVAVALEQFFDDDDAAWNTMMAIAIVYALPPIALFYGLRRFMAKGLTAGGIKG